MLIYPAIDIRGGQCVRLVQGQAEQETVYSANPIEVAVDWQKRGARVLHVADLDGAFGTQPVNIGMAAEMKRVTGLPVQIGGGYRQMAAIDEAMRAGLDRVILGTVAVKEPELVLAAVQKYGSRIVVSIDVAGDQVAVSGWKEVSGVRFEQLAAQMVRFGVQRLIFTDTRKDGTLTGPNIETLRVFLSAAGVPVILAGGMGRVEDVKRLKPLEPQGLEGVVIGKALYDRRIRLEEALQEAGPQVYAG